MNQNIKQNYISALRKKYEFEMEQAKANLSLYLSNNNLSAIGEHSDLLAEQDKWLMAFTEAKDKLESLNLILSEENQEILNG